MKILFITSNRIGDAAISSGLLDYMVQTWPNASVTIACGPLAVSLFEGFPNLDEVIGIKKEKHHKHWFKLWRKVVGTSWDLVVDLRNSAVSRLIRAKTVYRYGPHIDGNAHKVLQMASVMGLEQSPAPRLWFSKAQMDTMSSLIPEGKKPVIGVGPAANWHAKIWPAENFIEVITALTANGGTFPDAQVAVFAAPGEERYARPVLESVPEERRVDLIGRLSPGEAAAALSQCAFYIGNDSGLMHCAAACGIPTLGLFGPTRSDLYAPAGVRADFIRTPESFDDLTGAADFDVNTAPCLMDTLSVERVLEKIKEFDFSDAKAA